MSIFDVIKWAVFVFFLILPAILYITNTSLIYEEIQPPTCSSGEAWEAYCDEYGNKSNATYHWFKISEPSCNLEGTTTQNVTDFVKMTEYKGNISDIPVYCRRYCNGDICFGSGS
jgi:hypothetical protein